MQNGRRNTAVIDFFKDKLRSEAFSWFKYFHLDCFCFLFEKRNQFFYEQTKTRSQPKVETRFYPFGKSRNRIDALFPIMRAKPKS